MRRSIRTRTARLLLAALLVTPLALVGSAGPSVATAPTKAQVAAAKRKLDRLSHELEVQIEKYDNAAYRLSQTQRQLFDAKSRMDAANAQAAAARQQLSDQAVQAYTGMGSQLDVLLQAQDFSQFSDRLTFMGALAQSDADVAAGADAAAQRAQWAADEYHQTMATQRATVTEMAAARKVIQQMLDQQTALYRVTNAKYQDYMAQQRAADAAAAAAEAAALANDGSSAPGDQNLPPPPPPNSSAAAIAVYSAKSVLGDPYVWGAAGPDSFDCSGLTSWAWAQAGVYIPHSAVAQYDSLPRVPLSQIEPGDILFFYSPTSHVALYIGGGMMIHARHPGPGGEVQEVAVAAYAQPVGAVRPG